MDARIVRAVLALVLVALVAGANYPTPNFVIQTGDPQFAQQVGQAAEKYRRDLAVLWLGKALPNWAQPCPITVHAAPNLGAGGATTFVFNQGEVYGWRMTIQGSRERILDSVLPHEITHMILASHFRRPLPRWADEGAATSVEHASEQNKQRRMLIDFLQNRRGLPFNTMFALTEYPDDILPLYAQGYSLADFLIQQGGRRKYIDYLADALASGDWTGATSRHYGFANLGTLQQTWVGWVAQGSPRLKPQPAPAGQPDSPLVADAGRPARPAPNLQHHVANPAVMADQRGPRSQSGSDSIYARPPAAPQPLAGAMASAAEPLGLSTSGWRAAAPTEVPGGCAGGVCPGGVCPGGVCPLVAGETMSTRAARPQPLQGPEQFILR